MRQRNLRHPLLASVGAITAASALILVACDTRVPAPTAATDEEVATLSTPAEDAPLEVIGPEGRISGDTLVLKGPVVIVRRRDEAVPTPTPLFIVDGVIVSANAFERLKIEADRIESIEVMKGAAAAALYGSRAENGVIMITTKDAPGGGGA